MKKRTIPFLLLLLLQTSVLKAAITSVTLTPASPTTLSNGNSYYLAGVQYSFKVQAVDTAATGIADWSTIQLSFPSGESITVNINPPPTPVTGGIVFDLLTNNTIVYTNIDFTITLRFRWDSVEYNPGSNTVTATVTNINGSGNNTATYSFGRCSSIRVANFAQNGVAADGYVNPWHNSFNVTGAIVYNVTGATITDRLHARDPGEITNTTLYRDGASTGLTDNTMADDCTFVIPAGTGTLGLGNHTWSINAIMATAGGPKDSDAVYNLSFNCDRIRIDSITFINGGGINSPYYRSVNQPETQIQIQASRESGAPGGMVGNTTITVRNLENTQDFTIQIVNSATSGLANVPNPSALPALGTTEARTYQVYSISGSAFDNEQNIPARITQTPPNPVIYWDRNDPPGNNNAPGVGQTPFTSWAAVSRTATSFTLTWTALSALADPPWDDDFYTYRIYYRASGTIPWKIVDRTTSNYGPAQTWDLSNIATTSASITGLQPFTRYDYFITAVDVFGQEAEHPIPTGNLSDALYEGAPDAVGYGQIVTSPTGIEVTMTDGITQYTDNQFNNVTASQRPLRKTALRVTLYIITAGAQPDSVNLILAQDNGSGSTGSDLVAGGALNPAVTYEKNACSKNSPNTWLAYIPGNNQFLAEGASCRFIVESIKSGVANYADSDSEAETAPPGDPNNLEWTFSISTPTNFTPWPTRVLNNVLTDKNPVCYPAYYLSDDAYVTITVYDIKGRPVATLIDNSFRKGGQNIKEQGWSGQNKARKKAGVGLYYIRFEAKRASDGRRILNQTEKVVIAK